MSRLRALACCALVALAGARAQAHDSWLVAGEHGPEVVTGTRYPRVDLKPPPDSIARSGPGWVELREFEITLDDKLVDVYLREAKPPAAVRQRWQQLHAHGIGWRERYRKFMRIDTGAASESAGGLDLELVPVGAKRFEAGARVRFAALARDAPVPHLAVELVSERNPLGVWATTDEKGEVEWPLPFAGGWLVRTILIEPDGDTGWTSRFATYAFEAR